MLGRFLEGPKVETGHQVFEGSVPSKTLHTKIQDIFTHLAARVILEVSLSKESRSGNFSSPIPCGLFERRSVRLRASQDNAIRSVHNALLQKRRGALSKRVYIDQIILAAGLKFTREEAAEGFIKDVISLGSAGIGEMKWSR